MDWLSFGASFAATLLSVGVAVGVVLGRLRSVEQEGERQAKRLESLEGAAARLERATALLERSIEHLQRGQETQRGGVSKSRRCRRRRFGLYLGVLLAPYDPRW